MNLTTPLSETAGPAGAPPAPRAPARARPVRGLTLIEMVVTVAIIALLTVSVAPTLGTWITNQRVRNTATSIVTGLQFARTEAVRRNRPVTFWLVNSGSATAMTDSCVLAANSGSWVVTLGSASPASRCAPGTSALQLRASLASEAGGGPSAIVSVSATNTTGSTAANQVTFSGFGQVTNTTPIQQIDVTSTAAGAGKAWRVVVSSGGVAKLCDPSVTTATDPRFCS